MLGGASPRLLLPAPTRPTLFPFSVPVPEPVDITTLEGYALRSAILLRMSVRKTPNPALREIMFDNQVVGKAARSPYTPLIWVSSLDRRTPFYSLTDCAVYTVAAHLGL